MERRNLFEKLFSNKDTVKFPLAWMRCDINQRDMKAIQFSHCICRKDKVQDIVKTINNKKVVLFEDMSLHIYIMDINLEPKKVGCSSKFLNSSQELEEIIDKIHKSKICSGCASPESEQNVETSFAYRDNFGILRHKNCCLITSKQLQFRTCDDCRKGKSTLSKKIVRLHNQKCLQRVVLKWSPNKERKAKLLAKKFNISTRKAVRSI